MASAERLGDPFEGTVPEGEINRWKQMAANAKIETERKNIEHNRKILSNSAHLFREGYFVSCWHLNQNENYAMWDIFTNNLESVAIKTTYENLGNSLPSFPYMFMGLVRYIDYKYEKLDSMNVLDYIMHKRIGHEYEREVRVVASRSNAIGEFEKMFMDDTFCREDDQDFIIHAPKIDPSNLIKEIILHPESDSCFETKVVEFCKNYKLVPPEKSNRNQQPIL